MACRWSCPGLSKSLIPASLLLQRSRPSPYHSHPLCGPVLSLPITTTSLSSQFQVTTLWTPLLTSHALPLVPCQDFTPILSFLISLWPHFPAIPPLLQSPFAHPASLSSLLSLYSPGKTPNLIMSTSYLLWTTTHTGKCNWKTLTIFILNISPSTSIRPSALLGKPPTLL